MSPLSSPLVLTAVFAAVTTSALVDLKTRRVPNVLTGSITCVGLAFAASGVGVVTVMGAMGGLIVGVMLMLPGHLFGATGAGDVKLLGSLGTLLGPSATGKAFLYTAIAGGVLAVAVAVRRRTLGATVLETAKIAAASGSPRAELEAASRNNRFAYAPAIAVGTIAASLGV